MGKGDVFAPVKVLGMISGYYCFFTIKIDVKDNKYRLQLYNLNLLTGGTEANQPVEEWLNKKGNDYKKSLVSIDETMKEVITQFKTAMAQKNDSDF